MAELELRDKEEITRDIESSRQEVKEALHLTQDAWTGRNPAVRAWKAGKAGAARTKEMLVEKACATDSAVRGHIYSALGVAICVGTAIGFLAKSRMRKRRAPFC
jgi:ElaB/YqjD/DUF883 family membrane-anchored ribosome-binding protein